MFSVCWPPALLASEYPVAPAKSLVPLITGIFTSALGSETSSVPRRRSPPPGRVIWTLTSRWVLERKVIVE